MHEPLLFATLMKRDELSTYCIIYMLLCAVAGRQAAYVSFWGLTGPRLSHAALDCALPTVRSQNGKNCAPPFELAKIVLLHLMRHSRPAGKDLHADAAQLLQVS